MNYEVPWKARAFQSDAIDWAFFVSGRLEVHQPSFACSVLSRAMEGGKKGETTMANGANGNQFRDEEVIP